MTDEDDLIHAKVARVLNNTDLALNKGQDDDVQVGMKFAVLSDAGEEIRDPDTGEVLDSIRIAKTVVKVIHVASRSSVARTFRAHTSPGIFGTFGHLNQGTTRHETLASDESRVQQELDPKKAKVKVGDSAVQYTGEYTGILYDF
ncbi:hypothetical protein ACIPV2_00165 [Microbacterium sp. NPDC089987]|uniref:hypothetical protein n=1 Tax=Microbacterium sp. NPDC089987 TaxID=3364202 RepID=UPI00380235DF